MKYAVLKIHSFDMETDINVFATKSEALAYMQAEFYYYLAEEVRCNSDLLETSCEISTDEGYARVVWTDGECTEFRIAPAYAGICENHEKEVPTDELYELYKRDWCRTRNWQYPAVRKAELNDEEYNGQMYACKGEFLESEYLNSGYIDRLMSDVELHRTLQAEA